MRSMATELSRRAAIGLLGSGLLLPFASHAGRAETLCLNAYGSKSGFGVAAFDDQGIIHYMFDLPERGHGFACRNDGSSAVAFLRRPGSSAVVFDPRNGERQLKIGAAEDRSFCGHGAYSVDGDLLFATEVIGTTGEGVLGVYAAGDNYRRIAEWPTHGLDPHEICLFPDGRHLAIANGGILMRSDLPRMKLNIPDMDPSLVYLDASNGEIKGRIRPPGELHQLSLRHLAIDRSGNVIVAMQFEGAAEDSVPLVAIHGGVDAVDAGLRFPDFPAPTLAAMNRYCGSIALAQSGKYVAITCPRGNLVVIYDMHRDDVSAVHTIYDVCGVAAADRNGFKISNGLGQLFMVDGPITALNSATGIFWDNHITQVPRRPA